MAKAANKHHARHLEGKYDNIKNDDKAMYQKLAAAGGAGRMDICSTWERWRGGDPKAGGQMKEWHYGLKEGYVKSADVYDPIGLFNMPDEPTPKHGREKSQAHEVGPGRREHAKKKKAHEEYAHLDADEIQDKVDALFDGTPNGRLDRGGLEKLLEVLGCGQPVEDTEVDWVLAMADKDNDHMVARIDLKEIKVALLQYLNARTAVKAKFKKYAKKGEELLDREEVRALLTDLNDGIKIDDTELDWVLHNTAKFRHDCLAKPELERAISFWYNHAEAPEQHSPSQNQRARGGCVGRTYEALDHDANHQKKPERKKFP